MMLLALIYSENKIINLSSQYEVSHNKEDGFVIKNKRGTSLSKKNHIYSDHIIDLTCIAGKNGKGKTTILKDIFNSDVTKIYFKARELENESVLPNWTRFNKTDHFYVYDTLYTKSKFKKILPIYIDDGEKSFYSKSHDFNTKKNNFLF